VAAINAAMWREVLTTYDSLKNDLTSRSELSEMESLRLQMAMDRLSKLMSTMSNLLKKQSETSRRIIKYMK